MGSHLTCHRLWAVAGIRETRTFAKVKFGLSDRFLGHVVEIFACRPVAIAEAVFAVGRTAGPVGSARIQSARRVVWASTNPAVPLGECLVPD